MTLRDRMRRDASRALTRLAHFGETVTYHQAEGQALVVRAVVNRSMLQAMEGESNLAVRSATVFLPAGDDGVTAIADADEISLPLRIGGPVVRCRIIETLAEDEGGFLVRVVQ